MEPCQMSANVISPEDLRKVLDYDQDTGFFVWKKRPVSFFSYSKQGQSPDARSLAWNAVWAEKSALMSIKDNQYFYGRIFDRNIYAHRAAWCFVYGSWPINAIDHINGNRQDNRIENLRDVPQSENMKNTKKRKNNTTGKTGVYFDPRDNRWFAQISVGGKVVRLGRSWAKKEAVELRLAAEKEYGYTCRE
jgi:hypothetical protein